MKILIIGAGPTGLASAISLSQRGIIAEIVERRSEPSELSRAVGIMPNTRNLLRESGVADLIESEGMPFKKFGVSRGSKTLLNLDLSDYLESDQCMIGLPQNRTEALMAQYVETLGAAVKYSTELTALETTEEKATASFSDGTRSTYDWIIAADGIQSTARTQLDIPYPGIDLPETWSIADVDIGDGYDAEKIRLWVQGENRFFAIALPIERQRLRVASNTPDALRDLPVKLDIKNVRRTGTFNISVRQAESYLKGRVLLAGDAAHCHSPVGGRGMNLGIDDGFAAANAIVDGTVESYSDERHRIGAAVLKKTERARKMMTSENVFLKLFLNTTFGLIEKSESMQKKFIEELTTF